MNTIQSLLDQAMEHKTHKSDYAVAPGELKFSDDGKVIIPSGFGPSVALQPTDHAYGQVFNRVGEAYYGKPYPPFHMLNIPRVLMVNELNTTIPKAMTKGYTSRAQWFVRGYDESARAIMTTDYTVVDNDAVLKAMQSAINGGIFQPIEINQPVMDADHMHVKVTGRTFNTPDGNYGLGIMLSNDEVGSGRVKALPYIKRHKCDNSIMFPEGAEDTRRVHRGSVQRILGMLASSIYDAFKMSGNWLDKFIASKNIEIPKFDETVVQMAKKYGWSQPVQNGIMEGCEKSHTVYGMINGMTWAAHTVLAGDEQIELESLAGEFLALMTRQRVTVR